MEGGGITIETRGDKWHASPVTTYRGSVEELRKFLPRFERRAFGPVFLPVREGNVPPLFPDPRLHAGVNRFYDAIVRQPLTEEEVEIPVGIVSRTYTLLQHQHLVDEAIGAARSLNIDSAELTATLDLTEYGERMRLSLLFPERYNLKLGGENEMGLRLECFNSVEGSMKFMAVIGWLRFVCTNGLILGVASTDYRRRHNQTMEISEIAAMLHAGIAATTQEKTVFLSWMKRKIKESSLRKWVNGPLAKRWGVKAAVRTWHITRTGRDVTLADPFEKAPPTEKTVTAGEKVPGAVLPGDSVYAVAQSLSWLAKERRDVQEQLAWKQQIPEMVAPLMGRKAA